MTGEQIKAARKLLGWSQLKLSLEANVSGKSLLDIENGRSRPIFSAPRLKSALEVAGVEFPEDAPPRLKSGSVKRAT